MNHQDVVAHLLEELSKMGIGDFSPSVNGLVVEPVKEFSHAVIAESNPLNWLFLIIWIVMFKINPKPFL